MFNRSKTSLIAVAIVALSACSAALLHHPVAIAAAALADSAGNTVATAAMWQEASGLVHVDVEALALPPGDHPRTLKDLIDFNDKNRDREMPFFGQELFTKAEAKGPLTDPAYLKALKSSKSLSQAQGIDAVMLKNNLDAIIAPTGGPAWTTDLLNGDHFTGGSSTPSAVGAAFRGAADGRRFSPPGVARSA